MDYIGHGIARSQTQLSDFQKKKVPRCCWDCQSYKHTLRTIGLSLMEITRALKKGWLGLESKPSASLPAV